MVRDKQPESFDSAASSIYLKVQLNPRSESRCSHFSTGTSFIVTSFDEENTAFE